jgi:hypothetical protein
MHIALYSLSAFFLIVAGIITERQHSHFKRSLKMGILVSNPAAPWLWCMGAHIVFMLAGLYVAGEWEGLHQTLRTLAFLGTGLGLIQLNQWWQLRCLRRRVYTDEAGTYYTDHRDIP